MERLYIRPKRRLKIYKICLDKYNELGNNNFTSQGLCRCLHIILCENYNIRISARKIITYFKELLKYRPHEDYDISGHWFRSGVKAPRIKILKATIIELEHKIKTKT